MMTASFESHTEVPVEVVLLCGTRRLFAMVPTLKVRELLCRLGEIHKLSLFHELKLIFELVLMLLETMIQARMRYEPINN